MIAVTSEKFPFLWYSDEQTAVVLNQISFSSSLGEVASDFVLLAATFVARLVFLHCLFICWCTDPLENCSTQERHHVDFECTLQDFESNEWNVNMITWARYSPVFTYFTEFKRESVFSFFNQLTCIAKDKYHLAWLDSKTDTKIITS